MRFYLILLTFLLFLGCSSNKHENQSFYFGFTNQQWSKSQPVSFEFDITDTSSNYTLYGILRYSEKFTFSSLDLSINLITPSGSERYRDIKLTMRDENGDSKGTSKQDYTEISFSIYEKMKLKESGLWKIVFSHQMPIDIHRGLIGIEFFVEPK